MDASQWKSHSCALYTVGTVIAQSGVACGQHFACVASPSHLSALSLSLSLSLSSPFLSISLSQLSLSFSPTHMPMLAGCQSRTYPSHHCCLRLKAPTLGNATRQLVHQISPGSVASHRSTAARGLCFEVLRWRQELEWLDDSIKSVGPGAAFVPVHKVEVPQHLPGGLR